MLHVLTDQCTVAGHRLAADVVINFLQASILRATQKHLLGAAAQLADFIASSSVLAAISEDEGPGSSSSAAGNGGASSTISSASSATGCSLQASPHFYGCNTTRTLEKAAVAANLLASDGEASHALPPPLLLATAHRASSMCKLDEELKELVVAGTGWQWVDEGHHANHKWGFVANQSGSWLELQLSTTLSGMATGNSSSASSAPDALSSAGIANSSLAANSSQAARQQPAQPAPAHLAIIFLRSYEHMGTANVTCVMGCTCTPTTIDGHWETKASQPGLQPLLNVSQSERCVLKIEVGPGTRSGGHKVKILGVVLGSEAMSNYQLSKFSEIHNYGAGGRYGRRRLRMRNHV